MVPQVIKGGIAKEVLARKLDLASPRVQALITKFTNLVVAA